MLGYLILIWLKAVWTFCTFCLLRKIFQLFMSKSLCDEEIEDITWPRGDTKFLFECWKIFHEWTQRTSEIFFQHEKRNFVSPSGHVMFYLLYKHQWNTKPFHWNSFFPAKGAIYYVAIATVIFSYVKITCYFHVWRYHVFAWKLTWYFIAVYIIIQFIILTWLKIIFLIVTSHTNRPKKFQLSQVSSWPVMTKILKIKQRFKPGSLNTGNSLKICPVEKGYLDLETFLEQIHSNPLTVQLCVLSKWLANREFDHWSG